MTKGSGLSSPFQLFEPSLALTLGIAMATFGLAVLVVGGSPLTRTTDPHRRLGVALLAATLAGASGRFGTPAIRSAWTWLAVAYAVSVPGLVTVVGLRALVSPGTSATNGGGNGPSGGGGGV